MTPEVAARYAVFAMMSANAYHRQDRVRFSLETLGWLPVNGKGEVTDLPARESRSGLGYDIYRHRERNEMVFAFRGTDSSRDYATANLAVWPLSVQYTQADQEFGKYLAESPGTKFWVTGHSLGGGLALSVSVRHGVDAAVFDSSPRIFDGLGDNHRPAERVLIYQDGEALATVRKVWRKIFKVVPRENIFITRFDYGGGRQHRADKLALGLLKMAATTDPAFQTVLDNVIPAAPGAKPSHRRDR